MAFGGFERGRDNANAASVWKITPFSDVIVPIPVNGSEVPVWQFAAVTELVKKHPLFLLHGLASHT